MYNINKIIKNIINTIYKIQDSKYYIKYKTHSL